MDLQGKVVLITGGARHIGRETAVAAASRGATVAITYLSSERAARELARKLGPRTLAVRCDVRDPSSIRRAVNATTKKFGGIDVLVNNAGIYETAAFEKITLEQWDNIFATNARGPFLMAQACLSTLRERRGRIINLGSLGGLRPWPTHAHYCASKAALTMLSQTMARALAPEITVNCVAPGMIDTEGTRARGESLPKKLAQRAPMQRTGTPADVAAAVMFFAAAPYFITGQRLVVDGGLSLV